MSYSANNNISNLIIQWGNNTMPANVVKKEISFNTPFAVYQVVFAIHNGDSEKSHYCIQRIGTGSFYARVSETYTSSRALLWLAVGY